MTENQERREYENREIESWRDERLVERIYKKKKTMSTKKDPTPIDAEQERGWKKRSPPRAETHKHKA